MVDKEDAARTVTFACAGEPETRKVFLVGDFNNWDTSAQRMMRRKDGTFRGRVQLSPGVYQYKYYVDGIWVADPDAERKEANSYGTVNSVAVVD